MNEKDSAIEIEEKSLVNQFEEHDLIDASEIDERAEEENKKDLELIERKVQERKTSMIKKRRIELIAMINRQKDEFESLVADWKERRNLVDTEETLLKKELGITSRILEEGNCPHTARPIKILASSPINDKKKYAEVDKQYKNFFIQKMKQHEDEIDLFFTRFGIEWEGIQREQICMTEHNRELNEYGASLKKATMVHKISNYNISPEKKAALMEQYTTSSTSKTNSATKSTQNSPTQRSPKSPKVPQYSPLRHKKPFILNSPRR